MSATMTRTRRPLKGLLLYLWYLSGGKLIILNLQAIAWGIALLFFYNPIVHFLFGMNAIAGATFILIAGMGSKEIEWERFQLSMPVTRRNIASSLYISVSIAAFIGIPIYIAFTGFGSIIHAEMYFTAVSLFTSIVPFLSIPFILGGLVFPLYSIPVLERLYEGMFPALMLVAIVIPQGIVWLALRMEWSMTMASAIMLAVSLLIFIVSYFITRKLYEKMDF